MSRNVSRESVNSTDDGYSSDNVVKTPEKESSNYENQNIEFKQKYLVEKLLNNSANGVIYTGHRKSDMSPIVVKQIPKSRVAGCIQCGSRKIPPEVYYHIRATGTDGVCPVLDWYERRTSWVLVLKRNPHAIDLFELSSKYGALGEDVARIIIKQVVETSIKLLKKGVFHRDLKDENIMVDTRTLETQLIDFGCATYYDKEKCYDELMGTPEFFPPEYYTTQSYKAQSSTTWTVGVLMYILLVGDLPFESEKQIVSGTFRKFNESTISAEARSLLFSLLSLKPSSRPSLNLILTSDWVKQSDK